jgi:hypothetical protein
MAASRLLLILICPAICSVAACSKNAGRENESPARTRETPATTAPTADQSKAEPDASPERTTVEDKSAKDQSSDEWYRRLRERMKDPVQLGQVPEITLQKSPPIDARQTARVKALISALSKIDRPDYGFSATMSGHAFLPIEGQHESSAFVLTNHGLEPSSALKELVSLGPIALPFLLDSLDDRTPTKIKLEHGSAMGAMWFDQEMSGNPLNPVEAEALRLGDDKRRRVTPQERYTDEFTVKVGDICFVAIGQITGRSYQAVRYQPTACIVLNSPTHDTELARKVRQIWRSESPREHLLQSLLRDYCSIGKHEAGDSLDVWGVGSRLQCSAVLRLLYYYPDETGQMIAERLKSLDTRNTDDGQLDFSGREVKNGARTKDFVHAVSWSRLPVVRAAATDVFRTTTDEEILLAALPGVDDPEEKLIPERLRPLLEELPAEEGPIYGSGWKVLLAWTKASPKTAKGAMQDYVQNGVVQRLQSACAVLTDTSPDWKTEFLRPYLEDNRDLKSWASSETRDVNGQEVKIRLCDMAAYVLAKQDSSLNFQLEGSIEDVDRQIATMKEKLARRGN